MPDHTVRGAFAEYAELYWERGFRVIPIKRDTKTPALTGWTGLVSQVPSPERRSELLQEHASDGIGLLTAAEVAPGLKVGAFDVDADEYVRVMKTVLGPPLVAKRGRKGATFFVRCDTSDGVKSTKLMSSDRVGIADILFSGKMTVLPPSIHPDTGRPYEWLGKSLLEVDPSALPKVTGALILALKVMAGSAHAPVLIAGESTHDAGLGLAAQLVSAGADDALIERIFRGLLPEGYSGNSLDELAGWTASARAKDFDRPANRRGGTKRPLAEVAAEQLDNAGVQLSHDARGQAFITTPTPGGGKLTYRLGTSGAYDRIASLVYRHTGKPLREQTGKELVSFLTARAKNDGPLVPVHLRVAGFGSEVVVDLGDEHGTVVVISQHGWTVTRNSPVLFLRGPGFLALPPPRSGGGVDLIARLLGLPENNFVLVLGFLLNCLRPGGPFMCLLVEGEQGSGKSVLCSVIKRIIDPNTAERMQLPENNAQQLMVLANSFFLMVFDNSSGMGAKTSDLLCGVSTGTGYATRQLYTDDEVHLINVTRPFVINGISGVAGRPDILERAIPVMLTRMPDVVRKTEVELNRELDASLPDILGALYSAVGCALKNEEVTPAPIGIRMADAGRWIAAAWPTTGLPANAFEERLLEMQKENMIERVHEDAVVAALLDVLEKDPFEGTFRDLLRKLSAKFEYVPRFFPDSPLKLSRHFDRMKTGMRLAGIFVERLGKTNKGQKIRVWLQDQEGKPPATPLEEVDF